MSELGCNLDGEQSGPIIISSNQATGDGILRVNEKLEDEVLFGA